MGWNSKKEKLHKLADEIYELGKEIEKDHTQSFHNQDVGSHLKILASDIHRLTSKLEE